MKDMAEYIERKSAISVIRRLKSPTRSLAQNQMISKALLGIEHIPTAGVAPVVHGRWVEGAENFTCGNHNAECSACAANITWSGCDEDFNFCPSCGAKMDEGSSDA